MTENKKKKVPKQLRHFIGNGIEEFEVIEKKESENENRKKTNA